MSLESRADRTVWIEKTTSVVVRDDYGNEIETVESWPVKALRRQASAQEDNVGRVQQVEVFNYMLLTTSDDIDGWARIKDGNEMMEVVGTPEVVRGVFGVHHVEAVARRTKG